MKIKASIVDLIEANPSGLLQLKKPLSIPEYRNNFGFGLKEICTIYESKRSHSSEEDWFKFGGKKLDQLLIVEEKSEGDLLVVFIVETIKEGRVHCNLVLTDEAFSGILNDRNQHVLKVHQMYSQYWERNNIAINMATC